MPNHVRRVRVVLAASAVVAAALGVLAAPALAAVPTAVVTGVVTGADGFPLQDVTVQAQFQFEAFPAQTLAATVSAADGSYRLEVPLDEVDSFYVDTVADRATGGTSATGYADACAHEPGTNGCQTITPAAGSTTRHVDARLPRAAEIVGRLTDVHGRGVGGVAVYPWPVDDCSFLDVGVPLPGTTSDVNGNYRIPRLPAGRATVCVGSPYARDSGTPALDGYDPTSTALTLTAGKVGTANVRLVAGGGMSGTVVDAAHRPVAGAKVTVTSYASRPAAATAANGFFRVGRLATGRQTWCVTAPRATQVCGAATITSETTAKLGTIVLAPSS